MSVDIADQDDVSKRRIFNNYDAYHPLCTEPGEETIRLLQVLPSPRRRPIIIPSEREREHEHEHEHESDKNLDSERQNPGNDDYNDDDEEEIRVILFNVPASWHGVAYTALSYCWGPMTPQRTISLIHHDLDTDRDVELWTNHCDCCEGPSCEKRNIRFDPDTAQPFRVTENLYQALKCFRRTMSISGGGDGSGIDKTRCLWIDAICINQGDVVERASQVRIMHRIYSMAFRICVFLGEGREVVEGLRFIRRIVECAHETFGEEFDELDTKDEHVRALFSMEVVKKISGVDGKEVGRERERLDPESGFQVLERLFANVYFERIWCLQEGTVRPERTLVRTSDEWIPWSGILLADRYRELWRQMVPTGQPRRLLTVWTPLVKCRLEAVRECRRKGESTDRLQLSAPLYWLFTRTWEEFQATDPRDKLFALLGLAEEMVNRKGKMDHRLTVSYEHSASKVFSDFTRWCIDTKNSLQILGLLCCGPRRLSPLGSDARKWYNGALPKNFIDINTHPSWAIWPEDGGSWSQASLSKSNDAFDLASKHPVRPFKLPKTISRKHRDLLLPLEGHRLGVVKSVFRAPLWCYATSREDRVRYVWNSEETQKDMDKHRKSFNLSVSHPFLENQGVTNGILSAWQTLKSEKTDSLVLGDEDLGGESQEWLGRSGGRYEGKEECMFRDFVETLLVDPVYRKGTDDVNKDSVGDMPSGPWDDPIICSSLAMFWYQHDPEMKHLPPRIGRYLKDNMGSIPREKYLPLIFSAHGKCFFITEDERIGLCTPETRAGDLVVGLYGGGVPFTVRPMTKETDGERKFGEVGWSIEKNLKKKIYMFGGECYLHGRMKSEYFERKTKETKARLYIFC